MSKYNVLLFMTCVTVLVLALPVRRRIGHYFVFWQTSQELLPKLGYLQHKTRELIQHYFEEEYVNRTSGSEHSMDSAKDLHQRLNLTKFPSDRVLNRENRTNFIFIKGLLKENFRLCVAYVNILTEEKKFRCSVAKVGSLCDKTRKIEKELTEVKDALKLQLGDFFQARTATEVNSKRQRKVLAYGCEPFYHEYIYPDCETKCRIYTVEDSYKFIHGQAFNKKRQTDENEMKLWDNTNDYEEDSYVTMAHRYRRRNRASVGLLYAVYVHLQHSTGAIEYALRLLGPPRDEAS